MSYQYATSLEAAEAHFTATHSDNPEDPIIPIICVLNGHNEEIFSYAQAQRFFAEYANP